jgi:hypothetical protein
MILNIFDGAVVRKVMDHLLDIFLQWIHSQYYTDITTDGQSPNPLLRIVVLGN